jgi:hypothetical protein
MVYLITYDLNKTGKNYNGLYEEIKKIGKWWHYLDSNWLVDTNSSTNQISDALKTQIDADDNLLVIRVTKDYAGWLPKDAWEWLNQINYF